MAVVWPGRASAPEQYIPHGMLCSHVPAKAAVPAHPAAAVCGAKQWEYLKVITSSFSSHVLGQQTNTGFVIQHVHETRGVAI